MYYVHSPDMMVAHMTRSIEAVLTSVDDKLLTAAELGDGAMEMFRTYTRLPSAATEMIQ